eukprot:TRINITY_DN10776_c0_g2_i1.p6 TRINITY_DN10776_c0_g2~~TRINITY_DN10776_c0_g2_i1.p6  ORF type:complete len:105 (-),score=15.21 TRINITY_DN10776_c0_g2_i1:231-545(-)
MASVSFGDVEKRQSQPFDRRIPTGREIHLLFQQAPPMHGGDSGCEKAVFTPPATGVAGSNWLKWNVIDKVGMLGNMQESDYVLSLRWEVWKSCGDVKLVKETGE